jgi:hypothetical protein
MAGDFRVASGLPSSALLADNSSLDGLIPDPKVPKESSIARNAR